MAVGTLAAFSSISELAMVTDSNRAGDVSVDCNSPRGVQVVVGESFTKISSLRSSLPLVSALGSASLTVVSF